MRLLEIANNQWQILAPVEGQDDEGAELCPVLEFITGHFGGKYSASAKGLLAMLEKTSTSENGPRIFNDDQCHEVDKSESIFEFIKGDLRLLWFYGKDRKVVVCSHGFLKKSQKTPDAERQRAIALKKQYMKAHKKQEIEVIQDDD